MAHVNHGIRTDSDDDEAFVRDLALSYQLPFVSTQLELGRGVSEDTARQARYAWLEKVATAHRSATMVTAHHQDDVLETILINLIRGTGWRGLCSLRSTTQRFRPLLSMSKAEVVGYAIEHQLDWHEDSTNESFHYLRNRLRQQIVPRLTLEQRRQLLNMYNDQRLLRDQISTEVHGLMSGYLATKTIDRHLVIMVDQAVATELLRTWLGEALETQRMSDLLLFAKVASPGDRW
ncbi:MAG: tRNA lysidine(34) synthetase TilS, partial [Candidatus Saccharimonadales bacterium]